MFMQAFLPRPFPPPPSDQIADIRLAASKMTGATRRAFEAEMTVKYCGGNARLAEKVFGWGRHTVELGLAERRTGLLCLGAQSAFSGRQRWEDEHPHVAEALRQLADAHAQQDPTFRTPLAYMRLTAKGALAALRDQGYGERTTCPRPRPWRRCSTGWAFACAKWSKPNPKRRSNRPMQSSTTSKKRGPSHGSGRRQTLEHGL